jgi:cytochrome P450
MCDMGQLAYLPFAALLRPILASPLMAQVGGQMARDQIAYVEYANAQMADRIATEKSFTAIGKENPRKDFLSHLLHAKDPQTGNGFGKEELDADSSLLIAAGADTTSVTLSAVFFYLLRNPRVLKKLAEEVRGAFADVEEIRGGPKLNGLAYLRACIDETLRLAPPVPTHLPREVLKGGLQVDGELFPEGTVVGTSAYCMSHKEEYYPRAWEFRPERWILEEDGGEASKESLRIAKDAFCAFSLGTRGCVGRSVAYLELTLELARCLWLFEIRRAEKVESGAAHCVELQRREGRWGRHRKDEFQLVDRFLVERDGPMVEFRPRAA